MPTSLLIRPMGSQGLKTTMQGYGCMGLTAFYGPAMPSADGISVLRKAFDLGVRHFDTAEIYAGKNAAGEDCHNEVLLGEFLKTLTSEERKEVTFATKYMPMGEEKASCSEEAVRKTVTASLERLKESTIDLYYLHRCPNIDAVKNFMEAMKKLVAEGIVKYVGLSEATVEEIKAAHAIHPLTAIQQEWSLVIRNLEKDLVPLCKELGIGVVAYSPLARGLTSAKVKTEADWKEIGHGGAEEKFQNRCPYLTGENLEKNVAKMAALEEEAKKLNVSPAQLSLAWLHKQGDFVFPIPGTTKVANLECNVGGANLALGLAQDIADKIGSAAGLDVIGGRYPEMFSGLSYENK